MSRRKATEKLVPLLPAPGSYFYPLGFIGEPSSKGGVSALDDYDPSRHPAPQVYQNLQEC